VVAISEEIEQWLKKKEIRAKSPDTEAAFSLAKLRSAQGAGQRRARKLVKEVALLRKEQRRLLGLIRSSLKK
jgi:hypothetical protein